MTDLLKALTPILQILTPVVLAGIAWNEFNRKNTREQHQDDIKSRDDHIQTLKEQNADLYSKWMASEHKLDEYRHELDEKEATHEEHSDQH